MPKNRVHNEWFRTVSLGNRKSCPTCHAKLPVGESIWSWGNYINAKWRTITHFCRGCFHDRVVTPLKEHTDDCGCSVEYVGYRDPLPTWLKSGGRVTICLPKEI